MILSDLLRLLHDTIVIIEKETTIYGHSITVPIIKGHCESLLDRCTGELLEAEVRSITNSGVGLIVNIF